MRRIALITCLFAAGGRTIEAIDISIPANPKPLASLHSLQIFPAGRDDAHDLVYRNRHLYLTAQNSHAFAIVKINRPRILELAEKK